MLDIRQYLWKNKVLLIFTEPDTLIPSKIHNRLISQGYLVFENVSHYRHLLPPGIKSGYILYNLDGTAHAVNTLNTLVILT